MKHIAFALALAACGGTIDTTADAGDDAGRCELLTSSGPSFACDVGDVDCTPCPSSCTVNGKPGFCK